MPVGTWQVVLAVPCMAMLLSRHWAAKDGLSGDSIRPHFVICGGPEPCHRLLPSRWIPDFLDRVGERMTALATSGRVPVVMHIGAGALDNLNLWSDMHLYSETLSRLPLVPGQYRLALVEPRELAAASLKIQAGMLGFDENSTRIVQAAVNPWCYTGTVNMYGLSHRVAEDFGANYLLYSSWRFMSRREVAYAACLFAEAPQNGNPLYTHDQACFKRFCALGDSMMASYVEEELVPCHTPMGLLRAAGIEPGDVAMLIIDAEGLDGSIIMELLRLDNFAPPLLMFEADWLDVTEILRHLMARGYAVGPTRYDSYEVERNIVAVHL